MFFYVSVSKVFLLFFLKSFNNQIKKFRSVAYDKRMEIQKLNQRKETKLCKNLKNRNVEC